MTVAPPQHPGQLPVGGYPPQNRQVMQPRPYAPNMAPQMQRAPTVPNPGVQGQPQLPKKAGSAMAPGGAPHPQQPQAVAPPPPAHGVPVRPSFFSPPTFTSPVLNEPSLTVVGHIAALSPQPHDCKEEEAAREETACQVGKSHP